MAISELLNSFSVLMRTPGFPQFLGLFSVICVFLGSVLFTSNGHKVITLIAIATTLIVAEEILRAIYFNFVLGVLRPSPIALAFIVYVTMVLSVAVGYFAKARVIKATAESDVEIEKDVARMLVAMHADDKTVREAVESMKNIEMSDMVEEDE